VDRNGDGSILVMDLIQRDVPSWNDVIIRGMLNAEDAKAIMSVPLSPKRHADRRRWIFMSSGEYTVRYGYYVTQKGLEVGTSASHGAAFWRQRWHLRIHQRVKNLMWCFVHNILPTRVNLCARACSVETRCGICKLGIRAWGMSLWVADEQRRFERGWRFPRLWRFMGA